MQKWKCIDDGGGGWGFEKGKIYSTDGRGQLIDSNGVARIAPERFNYFYSAVSLSFPGFTKHVECLENK